MSEATRHFFFRSWPEFYDRLMVQVFFEPYARRLAQRLKGMTSGYVLEIAAGPDGGLTLISHVEATDWTSGPMGLK